MPADTFADYQKIDTVNVLPRRDKLTLIESAAQGSKEWLEARKTGIGGSEIAAILGLSPWNTSLGLWRQKKGLEPDTESSWVMKVGSRMEQAIAETWAVKNGVKLERLPFMRDAEFPHRSASLDFVGIWPDGHIEVLEIKWSAKGVEGIPSYYYTQVMWYMAVTGIHQARLIVADPWNEPEDRPIEWDADTAEQIIQAVDGWWNRYIVGDEAPEPSGSDERKNAAIGKIKDLTIVVPADETATEIMIKLMKAKADRDAAETVVKAIEADLAEHMVIMGAGKIDGGDWAASFAERAGSISYAAAVKALNVDKETLEQYRGKGSRYLSVRIKGGKE